VYRKNLQPVVYVTVDVAGGEESPVYAIMKMSEAIDKVQIARWLHREVVQGHNHARAHRPLLDEVNITVEVFRERRRAS